MSLHQLVSLVLPSKSTSQLVASLCVGIEKRHEKKNYSYDAFKNKQEKNVGNRL